MTVATVGMNGCFVDRRDAGQRLGAALGHLAHADPVVLALPRGGVPVGYEVARALKARLDVLLVRKVGAPFDPEFGIGAVADGSEPQVLLDDALVRFVQPPPGYIDEAVAREIAEIDRLRELYSVARTPVSFAGRTVILIDDGIATGNTIRAALRVVTRQVPAWLVLAVPVAPQGILAGLRAEVDEVVCLLTPEPFEAVSKHYADFAQTGNEEVFELLQLARGEGAPAVPPRD